MKKILTQGRLAALIVFVVLVIDQVIKICVKTGMYLHESIHITDWFYLVFVENKGMAFGMEILPGNPSEATSYDVSYCGSHIHYVVFV